LAAYHASLKERGRLLAANRLVPANLATSVRVRGERREVRDVPAVDTVPQLGGYMLVHARDLDEAIELAASSPLARFGTVEVRPVVEMPGRGGEGHAAARP
jgi:hypothetical protein